MEPPVPSPTLESRPIHPRASLEVTPLPVLPSIVTSRDDPAIEPAASFHTSGPA